MPLDWCEMLRSGGKGARRFVVEVSQEKILSWHWMGHVEQCCLSKQKLKFPEACLHFICVIGKLKAIKVICAFRVSAVLRAMMEQCMLAGRFSQAAEMWGAAPLLLQSFYPLGQEDHKGVLITFPSSAQNLTWAEVQDGDLASFSLLIYLCIFSESAFKLTDLILLIAFFCAPIQGDC